MRDAASSDTVDLAPPPKLPKGKKLVDTRVGMDVDSLFKSVFKNDNFFEIVGAKIYDEFRNFTIDPWAANSQTGLDSRVITYDLSKSIAFTKQNVHVEQTQVLMSLISPEKRFYNTAFTN